MFRETDMLLPDLHPLVLLDNDVFVLDVDPNTGDFFLEREGDNARLRSHDMSAYSWSFTQEGCQGKPCATLFQAQAGIPVWITFSSPGLDNWITYEGSRYGSLRKGLQNIYHFRCRTGGLVSPTVSTWTYERRQNILPDENRVSWIVYHWAMTYERLLRYFKIRDFGIPWQDRLMNEALSTLQELTEVVPSLNRALETINKRGSIQDSDVGDIQKLLILEIPPKQHEAIYAPSRNPWMRSMQSVERIAVTLRGGVEKAEFSVTTNTGPGQRASAGFRFLNEVLGSVPAKAKQNTGGKTLTYALDAQQLALENAYSLNKCLSEIQQMLISYGEAYLYCSEGARKLFEKFESWEHDEAGVRVAEDTSD